MLPSSTHRKFSKDVQIFCLVGGLPYLILFRWGIVLLECPLAAVNYYFLMGEVEVITFPVAPRFSFLLISSEKQGSD